MAGIIRPWIAPLILNKKRNKKTTNRYAQIIKADLPTLWLSDKAGIRDIILL